MTGDLYDDSSEDDRPRHSREAIASGVEGSVGFQGEGTGDERHYNFHDNSGFSGVVPHSSSAPRLPSPTLLTAAAAKFSKTPFSSCCFPAYRDCSQRSVPP